MHVVPAVHFSLAHLTEIWNLGYTGYFVNITFTEAMMSRHLTAGGIDLERSFILTDGESAAGFSFVGIRNGHGWIGGFGVSPAYRGKGLAYQLFAEHIAYLSALPLKHIQLEVFKQNWAQKVYARSGFVTTRQLGVFTGRLSADGAASAEGVYEATAGDLLAHHARLHAAAPACWQRMAESITAVPPLSPLVGLGVGSGSGPAGYLLYAAAVDGNIRIVDGAAVSEDAAARLVAALAGRHPGASVTIVNEPLDSPVARALVAAGAAHTSTQYEMHYGHAQD